MLKFQTDVLLRQVEQAMGDSDLTVVVGKTIHVHEAQSELLLVRAVSKFFGVMAKALNVGEEKVKLAFIVPDDDDDDAEGQDAEVDAEVEEPDAEVSAEAEGPDAEVMPTAQMRRGKAVDW